MLGMTARRYATEQILCHPQKTQIKYKNVWIFTKQLNITPVTPEFGENSAKNSKKCAKYPLHIFFEYGMIILVTVQYSR